ncbi:MAG: aminomethyltransferase [Candidatus Marinamargulisbacteria bacterium]|jgi:aminomethyltransferase
MSEMKKTALFEAHIENKGKMVPFGGYELPVWYSSLKDEHFAVRKESGIFDISHMGVLFVDGQGAYDFLQSLTSNNLERSLTGKMIYTMVLNEKGMILDDITVGKLDDGFLVVVNASNKLKILEWMSSHQPDGCHIVDLNQENSFVAVQGPQAEKNLGVMLGKDLSEVGKFSVQSLDYENKKLLLLRTGYTGEDGFEVLVPNEIAIEFWSKAMATGIKPCGLGARDTLRIEAGFPLYGQELSQSIHPFMTRYKWVVKFDKEFIGKKALLTLKEKPVFTTVGIEMVDRVIPRTDYVIKEGGRVTSGTMSPSLNKPIGMALVDPAYAEEGKEVTVEIRGKEYTAKVVKVPFV